MSFKNTALQGVAIIMGSIEKNIIRPICKSRINEEGKTIGDFLVEQSDKEEKLKEEHPLLWAAKKIGLGTLKGLLGVTSTKDY